MSIMSDYQQNKESADIFTQAIKDLASKPKNLENLNSYLSFHFSTWLNKWANTPEGLAKEMEFFANIGEAVR